MKRAPQGALFVLSPTGTGSESLPLSRNLRPFHESRDAIASGGAPGRGQGGRMRRAKDMDTETLAGGTLETWAPEEVAASLAKGEILLIDVRTPNEYVHEHIHGALLLPMQDFEAHFLPRDDRMVVLHCGSGIRSKMVAERILGSGVEKVAHMGGGFTAWKDTGQEYIGTNPSDGAPKRMRKTV